MRSWNSSAQLKIIGTEGHSTDSLRLEVERGAKFVIYSYNFSLVVVSFKRSSPIYFLRPTDNRIVKGLPFTLLSLVVGWWGLPWGIIFTIQTLITNFGGGKDVTRELLAALAPASADAVLGSPPPPPPAPLAPRRPPISRRGALQLLGGTAVIALAIYLGVAVYQGQHLSVALVSGLTKSYTVTLNGEPHTLRPGTPDEFTAPEGEFILAGAPGDGREQRFTFTTPFFSRPFSSPIAIINPDRVAVLVRETVTYHPRGTTPDPEEKADLELHANQLTYQLEKPEYVFTNLPETINLSSSSGAVRKTRLTLWPASDRENLCTQLEQRLGYEALRAHLAGRARLAADDEELQRFIAYLLQPADGRRIFETRLDERPVPLEWHRAYQFLMERSFPEVDLPAQYAAYAAKAPDDGALLYLHARTLHDRLAAHTLYVRALTVVHPCAYAHYALATEAFSAGDPAAALVELTAAELAGVSSESLQLRQRDALLALGRTDTLLEKLAVRRRAEPQNLGLFADELRLRQSQHPDRFDGRLQIRTYLGALRERYGASAEPQIKPLEDYLHGVLAYALGDEAEFARLTAAAPGPLNQFAAALARRDHAAAARAITELKIVPPNLYFSLYLAASLHGDATDAERYYAQALASLASMDATLRAVADHLKSGTAEDHAEILRTPGYSDELRVLFAALGHRFPAYREAYFARARLLNHNPDSPQLLLRAITAPPTAKI